MRLAFVLILLLSLPVLVIAHRQYYSTSLQGPLIAQMEAALAAPEFAQVKRSLTYMDVTLQGRVADLASRQRAQKLVEEVHGLRCHDADNLIQVSAKLSGRLTDKKLAISGWLHDQATLLAATRWLTAARPGIEINTDGVQISPHVTIENAPSEGSIPAPFRAAWLAIEVPSSLKVAREGAQLTLSGHLTVTALKNAVIAAMTQAAGSDAVDTTRLESGVYVRNAKFASEELLPSFLNAFFSTPGAARFEADAKTIHVSGSATPTMQQEWLEMLGPLARDTKLDAQLSVYPSVYHFPNRELTSTIQGDALTVLRDVLGASVVNFWPGYVTADPAEQPKFTAAASAITAAGPEVRIVVGGHVDLTGNPKENAIMARRRAEGVVADLASKGVPSQVLETAVFESVPGGADHSRQVELLVK